MPLGHSSSGGVYHNTVMLPTALWGIASVPHNPMTSPTTPSYPFHLHHAYLLTLMYITTSLLDSHHCLLGPVAHRRPQGACRESMNQGKIWVRHFPTILSSSQMTALLGRSQKREEPTFASTGLVGLNVCFRKGYPLPKIVLGYMSWAYKPTQLNRIRRTLQHPCMWQSLDRRKAIRNFLMCAYPRGIGRELFASGSHMKHWTRR